MELGNMIFGNSRGAVHVERGCGWEEMLMDLLRTYAPDHDSSYVVEFENETFAMRPYWWDDCTCSLEQRRLVHRSQHPHTNTCEWLIWSKKPKEIFKTATPIPGGVFGEVDVKALFDFGPKCNCGASDEHAKYEDEHQDENHDADCKLQLPNFHFKPTDYRLDWYKYPLRDSYANREVTTAEFEKMIETCKQSVQR